MNGVGEYLERKAVLKKMCEGCREDNSDDTTCWCNERLAIFEMPAADVAPVKHGHWEMSATYPLEYVCSCCGGLWLDFRSDYCPRCGAKMGGGTK